MNTESRIGRFLMLSDIEVVTFYAPEYLTVEIERHIPKLTRLTQQRESTIREIVQTVYTRITFLSDAVIPIKTYSTAAKLVRDIDAFDVQFVALAMHLDQPLWTGDMKLYRHLIKRGFDRVISFEEVQNELS